MIELARGQHPFELYRGESEGARVSEAEKPRARGERITAAGGDRVAAKRVNIRRVMVFGDSRSLKIIACRVFPGLLKLR